MSIKMNKTTYKNLITEDMLLIEKYLPDGLEKIHIEEVLKQSILDRYPKNKCNLNNYDIKDLEEIKEDITELDDLLTERVSDLHEVLGMMQARHAYIFYRKCLWTIRDKLITFINN